MYDQKGVLYPAWCCVWPALRLLLVWRGGEYALRLPPKRLTDSELDRATESRREQHDHAAPGPDEGNDALRVRIQRRVADQYDWWKLYLWSGIRRVGSAQRGGTTTVAVGIASILIPTLVALILAPGLSNRAWWIAGTVLVGGYGGAVCISYSAFVALRALPPRVYSRTMLAGASVTDTLRALSFEASVACRSFTEKAAWLHDFAHRSVLPNLPDNFLNVASAIIKASKKGDGVNVKFPSANGKGANITSELSALDDLLESQKLHLDRIREMKAIAAANLGVPQRRLCDHILQYSPDVHESLTKKYYENVSAITQDASDWQREDVRRRFMGLVRQNDRIYRDAMKRRAVLEALFEFHDLHEDIRRLAAEHSTSGVLLHYSRTIARLAREFAYRSRDLRDRLAFLYRKQRAYSGIDPHESCTAACTAVGQATDVSESESSSVNEAKAALHQIKRIAKDQSLLTDPQVTALQSLARVMQGHVADARQQVVDKFVVKATEFLSSDRPTIIVVHGYSKAVREAIREGLGQLDAGITEFVTVFVMHSAGDQYVDTQRMVLELTDDPDRFRPRVSSGDEHVLVKLVDEDTAFLVLLGVDAFSVINAADGVEYRAIHPRGVGRRIEALRKAIDKDDIRVWALAEGYKHHEGPLLQLVSPSHVDRVEVYGHILHEVITDTVGERFKPREIARVEGREHAAEQPDEPKATTNAAEGVVKTNPHPKP